MKEYDFIFGMGFSCGTSQALRAAGLQVASYPLDWVGIRDILRGVRMIDSGFKDWFEYDDFKLVDVRHGAGFCTRCYLNTRTDFGYSHEFPDFVPFSKSFPQVRETYARRVERFFKVAAASRRILSVYMGMTISRRATDSELVEARRILAEKFPHAQVDLLYIYLEPGCHQPELRIHSPGIFVTSFDYRKFDRGEITHFIEWGPLVPFLRDNFAVVDRRTEEEKRNFAAFERLSNDMRWGPDKTRFRRWLNKHLYKCYRSIERVLIEKKLIHREGPLWFWPDLDQGKEAGK